MSGLLDNIMGKKTGPQEDQAAKQAHALTMLLREVKIEAYVLHTKFASIVCVGGFDNKDDPRMRAMAEKLTTEIMPRIAQFAPQIPNQPGFLTQMMPMEIPH